MSHTQADVVQSRVALANAIHKEIAIHQGYITALRNALSGMKMVAATEQPVPTETELDAPRTAESAAGHAQGFVRGLAGRLASAGNGQ